MLPDPYGRPNPYEPRREMTIKEAQVARETELLAASRKGDSTANFELAQREAEREEERRRRDAAAAEAARLEEQKPSSRDNDIDLGYDLSELSVPVCPDCESILVFGDGKYLSEIRCICENDACSTNVTFDGNYIPITEL